jgi:hypothetical protein
MYKMEVVFEDLVPTQYAVYVETMNKHLDANSFSPDVMVVPMAPNVSTT